MNQVPTIMPSPEVIDDNNANAGVKAGPPNQVAIANEAEASAAVAATATDNSTKTIDSGLTESSNLLALLTAASRVETLPVEPEADAEDNDDQPGHLQLQARAVSESSTNSSPGLGAGPKRGPSFLTKGKKPKKLRRLPTSINTARPRLAGTAEAEAAAAAAIAGTSDSMLYTVVSRSLPATKPVEKETFPLVLYRVLMASSEAKEAEAAAGTGESSNEQNPTTKTKRKYENVITWLDSGTHFVILDPDRFMTEVMVSSYS